MSDTLTLIDANGNPVTVAADGLSPQRRALELAKAGGFNIPAGIGPSLGQQALDGTGAYGHGVSPAVTSAVADAQAAGFALPEGDQPVYGTGDTWQRPAPAMSRVARPDLFGGQVPRSTPDTAGETSPPSPSSASPVPSPDTFRSSASGPSGGPMGAAQASFTGVFPSAQAGPGGLSGNGMAKAYDQEAAAQRKAAEAAQERVQAEISAAQQAAEFKQKQAEEAQAQEQTRQTAIGDGTKKYEQAWTDFQKPDAKVNPNRYWADKSTGQKVLAGVAVFLSGLGNGLMGKGGNDALNILQKQVDDDINAQRENIGNERNRKRGNMDAASNALGMMRARFGDERAAEAATRAMQWDAIADTIRSKTLQSQSAEVRANGELALAGVAQKKAAAMNDLGLRNAQLALEQQKLGLDRQKAMLEYQSKLEKADPKLAQEARLIEERYRNIKANGQRLLKMIDEKGTWEATGSHNQDLDNLVSMMATDTAKMTDPSSVARESEVDSFRKQLVQAGLGTRNGTAKQVLQHFLDNMDERRGTAYSSRGMSPPDLEGTSLGPRVESTRTLPDGRTIQKLSDGSYRQVK